jgi:hypothetical protein
MLLMLPGQAVSGQSHVTTEQTLLAHAHKITSTKDWSLFGFVSAGGENCEKDGTYAWLDDHTVLFMRHLTPSYKLDSYASGYFPLASEEPAAVQIYTLDTDTGKEKFLTDFSARFNQCSGNPAWLHPSPDGKWAVWTSFHEGRLCAATLDGSSLCTFDKGYTDDAWWLPDSRHFVGLWLMDGYYFPDEGRLVGASLYDVQKPAEETFLNFTTFEYARLLGTTVTNTGRLLGVSSWPQGIVTVAVAPDAQYDWDVVWMPYGWRLEGASPSPRGDHVAWMLRRSDRSIVSKHLAIWISNGKGKKMRLLGSVTVNSKPGTDLELSRLSWLPDGKKLSFVCKNALYTIPVD